MFLIEKKYIDCVERKIYCITISTNLTIGSTLLYKSDNRWFWTTYKKQPRCTETFQRAVNKWPHIKGRLIWFYEYHSMVLSKKLYMQCQGCGEGIAKFRIRDPNHGHGNDKYNCCEKCVDFYDRRWSAMDIVDWKYGGELNDQIIMKPVCKKGSRCIEVEGGQRANEKRIKNRRLQSNRRGREGLY